MEQAKIRKNRFFLWAVIVTALNPIFSGLILGGFMLAEPDLRKEGKIVLAFAVIWGAIVLMLLATELQGTSILPFTAQ